MRKNQLMGGRPGEEHCKCKVLEERWNLDCWRIHSWYGWDKMK
jgi:hypothetical protein